MRLQAFINSCLLFSYLYVSVTTYLMRSKKNNRDVRRVFGILIMALRYVFQSATVTSLK